MPSIWEMPSIWALITLFLIRSDHFFGRSLACAPPPPPSLIGDQQNTASIAPRQPANSRAFGEQIHRPNLDELQKQQQQSLGIGPQASAASGPVREPAELNCYNFDDKCRWRNMEGFLVDELDWFQGAGFMDANRLRLATGTHLPPDGFYGIAATDKVEFAGAKAILVSDVVECQRGMSELRFMHWTSPEVKLTVCIKSVRRLFPYFDYCSKPVETNDPGPSYVPLPDLGGEPLQIFIQAHNFVFNSAALQGGFAIIDNLEYHGYFCSSGEDGEEEGDSTDQQFALSKGISSERDPARRRKPEIADNSVTAVPSLLDWMLYGSALARRQQHQQQHGRQAVSATQPQQQQQQQQQLTGPMALPTVAEGPMAHGGQAVPATQPPPQPTTPPPPSALRSIHIVQRNGPANRIEEEAEMDEEEEEPPVPASPIGTELRRGLITTTTYSPTDQPTIRRMLPHLELLDRRRIKKEEEGEEEGEREVEEKEEEEGGGRRRGGEEEMGMEPSHVEREEWIG